MANVEVFVLEGGIPCHECLPSCPRFPRIQQWRLPKHQGAEAVDHLWVSDALQGAGAFMEIELSWACGEGPRSQPGTSPSPTSRYFPISSTPWFSSEFILHPACGRCGCFPEEIIRKNGFPEVETLGTRLPKRSRDPSGGAGPELRAQRVCEMPRTSGHICLGLVIWRCHSWRHSKTGPRGTCLVLPDTFGFVLMVKELVRAEQPCRKSC